MVFLLSRIVDEHHDEGPHIVWWHSRNLSRVGVIDVRDGVAVADTSF